MHGDSLCMLAPTGASNRKPLPLGMGYITVLETYGYRWQESKTMYEEKYIFQDHSDLKRDIKLYFDVPPIMNSNICFLEKMYCGSYKGLLMEYSANMKIRKKIARFVY